MTGFDLPQNFHSDPESLLRRTRAHLISPQSPLSAAEPVIASSSASRAMAQKTLRDYCWRSLSTHFDRQLSCKNWASEGINVSIGWLFDEFHRFWSENVCRWIWAKTAWNKYIIQGTNPWSSTSKPQGQKGRLGNHTREGDAAHEHDTSSIQGKTFSMNVDGH